MVKSDALSGISGDRSNSVRNAISLECGGGRLTVTQLVKAINYSMFHSPFDVFCRKCKREIERKKTSNGSIFEFYFSFLWENFVVTCAPMTRKEPCARYNHEILSELISRRRHNQNWRCSQALFVVHSLRWTSCKSKRPIMDFSFRSANNMKNSHKRWKHAIFGLMDSFSSIVMSDKENVRPKSLPATVEWKLS